MKALMLHIKVLMSEYIINVREIEEWQMIGNIIELSQIFTRAQSAVVQGGVVTLVRQNPDGTIDKFDEMSTEDEIKTYKEKVFKYL